MCGCVHGACVHLGSVTSSVSCAAGCTPAAPPAAPPAAALLPARVRAVQPVVSRCGQSHAMWTCGHVCVFVFISVCEPLRAVARHVPTREPLDPSV